MMVYDYNILLKVIKEAKTNKIIAENERTANKKNKLIKLEQELELSGLLDDWDDLKRTCREMEIRIMPYGGWDEAKQGTLMEDYEYFRVFEVYELWFSLARYVWVFLYK